MENDQTQINQPLATPLAPVSPSPIVQIQPKQSQLPVVLLSLLSLIFLAGMVYFSYQTQSLKQQLITKDSPLPTTSTQTSADIDTASPSTRWTTYINKQIGFSFSYPVEWKVEEGVQNSGLLSLQTKDKKRFFVTHHQSYSIQEWLDDTQSGTITGKKPIGDYTFTVVKGGSQLESLEYLIEIRGAGFVRFVVEPNTNNQETEQMFNEVLSTFKLIN